MALVIVEADLANLFKFQEAVAIMGLGRVKEIAAMTLNQVGRKMATQVKRDTVQQTGLKYGEVNAQMHESAAFRYALAYSLTGAGRYFGVGHFGAREQGSSGGLKLKQLWGPVSMGGVTASPWNRRQLFRHAFMVGSRVFVREGKDRYPIKFLYGSAVPREMERDAIPQDFIAAAEHELPAAIDKKLNQFLPW